MPTPSLLKAFIFLLFFSSSQSKLIISDPPLRLEHRGKSKKEQSSQSDVAPATDLYGKLMIG
jgi:hypothetical protein